MATKKQKTFQWREAKTLRGGDCFKLPNGHIRHVLYARRIPTVHGSSLFCSVVTQEGHTYTYRLTDDVQILRTEVRKPSPRAKQVKKAIDPSARVPFWLRENGWAIRAMRELTHRGRQLRDWTASYDVAHRLAKEGLVRLRNDSHGYRSIYLTPKGRGVLAKL